MLTLNVGSGAKSGSAPVSVAAASGNTTLSAGSHSLSMDNATAIVTAQEILRANSAPLPAPASAPAPVGANVEDDAIIVYFSNGTEVRFAGQKYEFIPVP